MKLAVILSIVALSSAGLVIKPRTDQLTVDAYYDVFDAASLSFLQAQNQAGVWDLMTINRTELVINFNPMATATLGSDGNYTCYNDANCHATRLHACAIKEHESTVITNHQIFEFIICTASHSTWLTDPDTSVNQCVNQIEEWPDDFVEIEVCSRMDDSLTYIADFYTKAQAAAVTTAPTVFVGGTQNSAAVTDLLAAVCAAFTGGLPAECSASGTDSSTASTASVPAAQLRAGIFYDVFDTASLTFLQAQNRSGVWDLMTIGRTELAIDFNPMATATPTGDGNYTCLNDPNCHATRLQACAIKDHEGNVLTNHQIFEFIICSVSHSTWLTDPDNAVNECVNQIEEWPDDFVDIEICSRMNDVSLPFLDDFYNKAQAAAVTKAPTVLIGGVQNDAAVSDLLSAVCAAFTGTIPAECSSAGTTSSSATSTVATAQLRAGVFYDVFGTSSLSFLQAQNQAGVWDLMTIGRTELAIDFNPIGTATPTGDGNYTCYNDANCHATRLHACAIKDHEGNVLTNHQIFEFIICTVSHSTWLTDPDNAANECANQIEEWPDDFVDIEICSKMNDVSLPFLDDFYQKAQTAGVTTAPTVFVGGVQNDAAITDFLSAVCSAFTGTIPAECTAGGSTSAPGGAAQLVLSNILAMVMLALIMLR